MKQNLKVVCEIGDNLAGYKFIRNGKAVEWEDLTRQEQIKALNSLHKGYEFFGKFLKKEE